MIHLVIPARLNSLRLPNKMLLARTGKPLVVHTVEAALRCRQAQRVTVVSEDLEIVEAVRAAFPQGRVIAAHEGPAASGTERIANHHANTMGGDNDLIINLQGDEPEFPGEVLDELVAAAMRDRDCAVITLATPATPNEMTDYNVAKVVCDHNGKAMYFSRSPIPTVGEGLRHLGVYLYRGYFLRQLPALRPTAYPGERLEQLQWLEAGCGIRVVTRAVDCTSIDTLEQYVAFTQRYLGTSQGESDVSVQRAEV